MANALKLVDSEASELASAAALEAQHEMVDRLDAAIRATLPCLDIQTELPPIHHFAAGLYARSMVVPAGMLLVGMLHTSEHISILSAGSISVWSVGGEVQHFEAPHIFVGQPGARRIGFTHSDVVWTTIHATDATTVEDAERQLLVVRPPRESADPDDIAALQQVMALLNVPQLEGQTVIEGEPV